MYYTTTELAKKIGKNRNTVLDWAKSGVFPNAFIDGRVWKIPEEDVEEILKDEIVDKRILQKSEELVGKVFGGITILRVVGYKEESGGHGRLFVEIGCECGEIKEMPFYNIERGSQKYCSNQCPAKSGFYIGQRIHNVTIIEDLGIQKTNRRGRRAVKVKCRCGKERDVPLMKLKIGSIKSCSKHCQYNLTNIVGERYGRLVVLKEIDRKSPEKRTFLCKCDCGNEVEKTYAKLVSGWTKFCGHGCELRRGEGNPNWNPEITEEERIKGRDYFEYKQWRRKVFEKDAFTCQCCGQIGGNLVAHHKDGYHWCVERRTDVENGVTLCEECHDDFHSKFGYRHNSEKQYIKWQNNKKVSV